MVNFLLLFENIIEYNKRSIDKGLTPQKVYEICSCIRETFCISYSIRKSNNLYLYFQKEQVLIKFEGIKLRYLGPDERSQALLLKKALNKVEDVISSENDTWIKSTPGIYIRKFFDISSFKEFYKSIATGKSFLLLDNLHFVEEKVENFKINDKFIEIMENDFFIIPIYRITREITNLIGLFKEMKKIKLLSLLKIKDIENKILYINFRKDQQRTL